MICEHCGCVFCYDDADQQQWNAASPKLYCSATCRKAVKRAAKRRRLGLKRPRPSAEAKREREVCARKLRYPDEEAARTALAEVRAKDPRGLPGGGLYPCEVCGEWHITSRRYPSNLAS